MDHVVYLDHKAKELENLASGDKTMIIRGAMGRKLPHGRVDVSDTLYFIQNNGEGLVQARAKVSNVYHSEKLTPEDSTEKVTLVQDQLMLDKRLLKRFSGKRYLVLISISNFEAIEAFPINKSDYKNMDDWLPVGDISTIKIRHS